MNPPIADLHCDLLLYLSGGENRTPFDERARCSLPQLKAGGVKLQVLPIFSETFPGSSRLGQKQLALFETLPKEHFIPLDTPALPAEKVGVLLAFENASGFCAEEDDLQERLQWLESIPHKILYISLTWNSENRFGGGALTSVGLKEDGKRLLDFLHGRKICVDLSHASDSLAFAILNYCEQKQLDIPLIASHSNFQEVKEVARNLPDALAKEIIARGGVIGLNFVGRFLGESPDSVGDHLEHMLQLNGEKQYCFGADFYYSGDLSPKDRRAWTFFEELGHSGTYPYVFKCWRDKGVSQETIERVAHENLIHFLKRQNW